MSERSDPVDDPLAQLRSHVQDAQLAAERLARETVAAHASTPPTGWASDSEGGEQIRGVGEELRSLTELLASLRELLPEDLREQLLDLARRLLVVLRALLDVLLERLERGGPPGAQPTVGQDIPIF